MGLEKGRKKKGNLDDEKLGKRFQSFRPIVHGNRKKDIYCL